jgi:hypothetical protein
MALPAIVSYLQGLPMRSLHFAIMPASCLIVFYLNYLWFIDRYFFTKKIPPFILINFLCVALLCLLVHSLSMQHFAPDTPAPQSPLAGAQWRPAPAFTGSSAPAPRRVFPVMPFFLNAVLLALVVSAGVAIKATTRWYRAQASMVTLEKEKSVAALQQLKSQLNPHFLFNSLNNIYALIAFDPTQAQAAIHTFGDMLRHQLYETASERIALRGELDFIRNYCRIMQLRLPPHVALHVELPDDDAGIMIAPLLFVPLVENAFKHGLSPLRPAHISISITIHDGRRVACAVRNRVFPKNDDDRTGSGIGLDNLHRRLELLYPGKYSGAIGAVGNEFVAEISILCD